MKTKDLSHYRGLKYSVALQEGPGGGYFVTHPDLDGCMAEGGTLDEAIANLGDSREVWIATRLENGYPVPEPRASGEPEYSGRVSLRMAPSLHERLARLAERSDVSLNLLLNTILASYAGGEDALTETKRAIQEALDQLVALSRRQARSA
jgi:antitoxin HicB